MTTIKQIFHADHNVSADTVCWALDQIRPEGFFLRTLELPADHHDLQSALYGPLAGDAPVDEAEVHYASRGLGRAPSRLVSKPGRPTRLVTVIGVAEPDGVLVFTAHGGPAAEREPGDKSLDGDPAAKARAEAFWAAHALAAG
jgi:hypothetical protein